MIYQKIAFLYIYLVIYDIVWYCNACVWSRTLKTGLGNFCVIFLNSDFSVDIESIPIKFLGNVLYNTLEGSVSQNFDLGPG